MSLLKYPLRRHLKASQGAATPANPFHIMASRLTLKAKHFWLCAGYSFGLAALWPLQLVCLSPALPMEELGLHQKVLLKPLANCCGSGIVLVALCSGLGLLLNCGLGKLLKAQTIVLIACCCSTLIATGLS